LIWQIGKGRQRRLTRGQKVVFAISAFLGLGLSLYVFGGAYLKDRTAALALARELAVEGPPCPSLTRAEFETRGVKAGKTLDYAGVTASRQFGHVSCSQLRYGEGWSPASYVVCQFTSPNMLRVETPKGEWYFAPGMGQPATISTPHDEAFCVMASKFTLNGGS